MKLFNIGFILINLSLLLMMVMIFLVVKMRGKKQIHYAFICLLSALMIWIVGATVLEYYYILTGTTNVIMVKISYIGLILTPVAALYLGVIFAKTKITFSKKQLLLFIIPLISIVLVFTNEHHHLFYKYIEYTELTNADSLGRYFIIHTIYSYICIVISMFYLLYFSIKNAGFFSKQSFLLFVGILTSFVYNFLITIQVFKAYFYTNCISFIVFSVFLFLAIFKFNFLNIAPIALQKVVDLISDAFVVLDENQVIIDFNKSLKGIFDDNINLRRNMNFTDALTSISDFNVQTIMNNIKRSTSDDVLVKFEMEINERFFTVEISSIKSYDRNIGSLILLKDITEHKKNLATLKEHQEILLEQERLASLGQLIGGIAHNLKTPIMSLAGGIEALKDLTLEYKDSIGDSSVIDQDHLEIAREMLDWLEKMKPYCAYMSDVISAVKGQAVQMNASTSSSDKFTIDELIKRVNLLMRHELKKYHCVLNIDVRLDVYTEIKGEVNNLVQVFDNIIINAIHSYEGREGNIDLRIVRAGDNVEFIFRDYGKGIPKSISDKLFKEMVTTKGKMGTGLGLYMSYSTIKGRFGGNMSFTSYEGEGTSFYLTIPCITYQVKEAFE